MVAMMALMVFAGALTLALATIWLMVAPQWRRIARLATGHQERPFTPLEALVHAERRIAVKRWSMASRPAFAPVRARAAA